MQRDFTETFMTILQISLLGGFRMEWEGQVLPLPSPSKALSLLACLLIYQDRLLGRDQVGNRLWPNAAPAEARSNLRRHLHLLRQALPPGEWILSERDTLHWNPEAPYWLDVSEFLQQARQCTSGPQSVCERCLQLYQGDLLPEIYDDWLIAEREALRNVFLQTLDQAIGRLTQCGEYATALYYAKQLLAHDPLHEQTHRRVMQLHYLAGDRQAALQQFAECEALLRRELDVVPMQATRELQQMILAGEPLPAAAPGKPSPAPTASLAPTVSLASTATANPPPAPRIRPRWRWALAALLLVALVGAGAYWINTLLSPREALIISGPGVTQDTWITEMFPDDLYWPDDPDRTPHARYSRAHLQYFDNHPLDRILIRFDLGLLPQACEIEQATFEIHLETWLETEIQGKGALTQTYPAMVSVFPIQRTWQADQATFNQAASGQWWSAPGLQPGLDFASSPLDVQPIDGTAWLSFDVTQAARSWQHQAEGNYGLMLEISEAPEDVAHYWVDTSDQATSALRPALKITYRRR